MSERPKLTAERVCKINCELHLSEARNTLQQSINHIAFAIHSIPPSCDQVQRLINIQIELQNYLELVKASVPEYSVTTRSATGKLEPIG